MCGKSFDKKINYGRHLTVHKNRDHAKENQDSMEICFGEENDMNRDDDELNEDNEELKKEGELNEEDELSEDGSNK